MVRSLKKNSHFWILIFLATICVTAQIVSTIIGYKLIDVHLGTINLGTASAGIFFFPLIYACEDATTELFGSGIAKIVIWATLCCVVLFGLAIQIAIWATPDPTWHGQQAFQQVLSHTFRLGLAIVGSVTIGDFINVLVLARWKIFWKGKWYFVRSLGSSCIGEAIDTIIGFSIAFLGILPIITIAKLILATYILKIVYATFAAFFATPIVRLIKKKVGLDTYDKKVYLNPFKL